MKIRNIFSIQAQINVFNFNHGYTDLQCSAPMKYMDGEYSFTIRGGRILPGEPIVFLAKLLKENKATWFVGFDKRGVYIDVQ